MINWTEEEDIKLELIDKLFAACSLDDLRELAEREAIVSRLRGTQTNIHRFSNLINEHTAAQTEIVLLRNEITVLKEDMRLVIKIISGMNNTDLMHLKSKYNVY
jgi:hypothetical protein